MATRDEEQFLIMDYGANLQFTTLKFVLINKETFSGAEQHMSAYMHGTNITLLDERDKEVYVACESLTVIVANIDTIADQTYTMGLGETVGRKVKFQTDESNPNGKRILVVESWATVKELDPG